MEVVRAGERMGCTEALFSLGDKPELLFPEMRETLRRTQQSFAFGIFPHGDYKVSSYFFQLSKGGILPLGVVIVVRAIAKYHDTVSSFLRRN